MTRWRKILTSITILFELDSWLNMKSQYYFKSKANQNKSDNTGGWPRVELFGRDSETEFWFCGEIHRSLVRLVLLVSTCSLWSHTGKFRARGKLGIVKTFPYVPFSSHTIRIIISKAHCWTDKNQTETGECIAYLLIDAMLCVGSACECCPRSWKPFLKTDQCPTAFETTGITISVCFDPTQP